MKYSGANITSTFQYGSAVYVLENDIPLVAKVIETESIVTSGGSVIQKYKLDKFGDKQFLSSEVFADAAAIKTDFGSKADTA